MLGWYGKCHVTSNKANSNLECAEEKFQTREWVQGCEKWKAATRVVGESGRTSVKKLFPPQAMRGIWLGMRGLVRSYVTLAIPRSGHDHFLPNPFQLIIHKALHGATLCSLASNNFVRYPTKNCGLTRSRILNTGLRPHVENKTGGGCGKNVAICKKYSFKNFYTVYYFTVCDTFWTRWRIVYSLSYLISFPIREDFIRRNFVFKQHLPKFFISLFSLFTNQLTYPLLTSRVTVHGNKPFK
jgi:hypothetical protein